MCVYDLLPGQGGVVKVTELLQEPESAIDHKTYDVCLSAVAHVFDDEHDDDEDKNNITQEGNIGVTRTRDWHSTWTELGLFSPGGGSCWSAHDSSTTSCCWSTHSSSSSSSSISAATGWPLGFFGPGGVNSANHWSALNSSSSSSSSSI